MIEKLKVGVTGVGGSAGVITLKSLKKKDIKTVGMDCNPLSAGMKLADKGEIIPFANNDKFISRLLEICKEEKLDVLIPTVDEELLPCSLNKEEFEKNGVKVAVSDPETIETSLDKWLFYNRLKFLDLPVPKTVLAEQTKELDKIDFPVIVKPRVGRGGRGVKIIKDSDEMNQFLKSSKDFIIQDYIEGEEYTIDTLSDFGGNFVVAVPRKRIEVKGGVCWKGVTEYSKYLIELAAKTVEGLGIKGPACMQLILTKSGKAKIFEINPRLGGTTSLSVAAGVDFPFLTVKSLFKEEINKDELKFKKLYIARYFEDIYFEEREIEK